MMTCHHQRLVFELENEEKDEISDREKDIHDTEWMTWDEIGKDKNIKMLIPFCRLLHYR